MSTISKSTTPIKSVANYCVHCGQQLAHKSESFFQRRRRLIKILVLLFVLVLVPYLIISQIFGSIQQELTNQAAEDRIILGQGTNTIALINIDGVIIETAPSGFGGISDDMTTSRHLKKLLKEIKQDETVKAVIIRINSPGGSAAAAEEMLHDLQAFKQETQLPIIAYFADTAASGGYYVAMAADHIVANPSGITGSIGVIISYLNLGELVNDFGIKPVVFKSGEHKDLGSAFRDPTQAESAIFQSIIDDDYENFIQAVMSGRNLDEATVRGIADGRIFSAKQAVENKLVDSTGFLDTAFDIAKQQASISDAALVEFGQASFIESLIGSMVSKLNFHSPLTQSALGYLINQNHGPKILFLYSQ